jgi:hypothetical protein
VARLGSDSLLENLGMFILIAIVLVVGLVGLFLFGIAVRKNKNLHE